VRHRGSPSARVRDAADASEAAAEVEPRGDTMARVGKLVHGVVVCGLAGAMPVAASAQQVAASASLVFEGVTVVDVERGNLVLDQRVVITGNRIQTVGNAGAVQTPLGAQVVDARGKYQIPGLWDMHVHNATVRQHKWLIANGITGARYPSGQSMGNQCGKPMRRMECGC